MSDGKSPIMSDGKKEEELSDLGFEIWVYSFILIYL